MRADDRVHFSVVARVFEDVSCTMHGWAPPLDSVELARELQHTIVDALRTIETLRMSTTVRRKHVPALTVALTNGANRPTALLPDRERHVVDEDDPGSPVSAGHPRAFDRDCRQR